IRNGDDLTLRGRLRNRRVFPLLLRNVPGIDNTLVDEIRTPLPGDVLRNGSIPENGKDRRVIGNLLDETVQELRESSAISRLTHNLIVRDAVRDKIERPFGGFVQNPDDRTGLLDTRGQTFHELPLPLIFRGGVVLRGAGQPGALQASQKLGNPRVALRTEPDRV